MTVTFTNDLLTGLAQMVEDAGLGTYRSDGSMYLSTETAIVLDLMPQTPDNCIAIDDYPLTDDPYPTASGLVGVQLQLRTTTRAANKTLRDGLYQLLHAREKLTLGTIHVAVLLRQNVIELGQDDSQRWESTSNFYATVDYPPTQYRPD